jgi:F-type H+-transporting ATPase subunit epsilon
MPSKIGLEIVTPERLVYNNQINFLEATAIDGEIGILPGHAPLVTILKEGILRVTREGQRLNIEISEGFMEVKPGKINIIVGRAEKGDVVSKDNPE